MGVPRTRETGVRSMSTLLVGRGSESDPRGEARRVSIDSRVLSLPPCKATHIEKTKNKEKKTLRLLE